MKFHLLRLLAATALLLPAAPAQLPIVLTGTIERLAAPACDPAATHRVRCTGVLLKSTAVDLASFEGRTVDIEGPVTLRPLCTVIDVQTANAATTRTLQLALFGTRLGRPVTLTTFSPPGSVIAYVWSGGRGFLPLGPLGTMLIDAQSAIVVGTSVSIGIDIRTERIPNDPNLVGVDIHYQFAYVSLATGLEAGFLDPGCFRIAR